MCSDHVGCPLAADFRTWAARGGEAATLRGTTCQGAHLAAAEAVAAEQLAPSIGIFAIARVHSICAVAILAHPFCGAEASVVTIQWFTLHVGVAGEALYEVRNAHSICVALAGGIADAVCIFVIGYYT